MPNQQMQVATEVLIFVEHDLFIGCYSVSVTAKYRVQ